MLRRLAAALTGRGTEERLAALEQAVRKLGDAGREQTTLAQERFADIAQTLSEQPTSKDLRELRQALRAVAAPPDHQHLFDTIDTIATSGRPVFIGPWTGEVGFELLYWIPFVEWARARGKFSPEHEIIVSRGGVESWYGRPPDQY